MDRLLIRLSLQTKITLAMGVVPVLLAVWAVTWLPERLYG